MSLDRKTRNQSYKEAIESIYLQHQMDAQIVPSADDDNNTSENYNKLNEIWEEGKSFAHDDKDLKAYVIELSTMQGKGTRQSSSVRNGTTRLYVCASMVNAGGKFLEECDTFCPFFVHAKRPNDDEAWSLVEHKGVGKNCHYHNPQCKSTPRSIPVKKLSSQMEGVLTGNDQLNSTELTKTINETPSLNIRGKYSRKGLNRARSVVNAEGDVAYAENYNKIPLFCEKFESFNCGSFARYDCYTQTNRFIDLFL